MLCLVEPVKVRLRGFNLVIHYLQGDATRPMAAGQKIIVTICTPIGLWGKGFVLALSGRWYKPEQAFYRWYSQRANNDFRLGAVQFIQVESDICIANLVGQHNIIPIEGVAPIRYAAVDEGLEAIAVYAKEHNASVHMPRIGCGLAGGQWSEIEKIIDKRLIKWGVPVYVYDYN